MIIYRAGRRKDSFLSLFFFINKCRDTPTMADWINAPIEEAFDSLNQAEAAIYQHAFDNGYALTRLDIKYDKKKPRNARRWDFRCDKGGIKRGHGAIRESSTRMTECDFELRIHRMQTGGFKLEVYRPYHNHPSSEDARQHSQYRQPTNQQQERIESLTKAGVAPRFILNELLEADHDTLITTQEIYNCKAKVRKERLSGKTPIEVLVEELLEDDGWALQYHTEENGVVNFLFFTPDEMIDIAQASPSVILIDATYRTNKYNLPAVHFQTVTPIGKTASISLAFVTNEEEASYRLAVSAFRELVMGNSPIEVLLTDDEDALKNALTAIFPTIPQLLCLWHVNKNVLTKVQQSWITNPAFSDETNKRRKQRREEFMADWEAICYARTEQEFEERYSSLREKYFHQSNLLTYLHEEKYPKRQQFAKPWTSQVCHFGHTVTSRAESGHSKFKGWLLHSRHDLLDIKDRWASMTRTFLTDYRKELATERDRITHELRVTRWNPKEFDPVTKQPIQYLDPELNNQVVDRALRLLVKQLEYARDDVQYNMPCSGQFEKIHGIPCYHTIREFRAAKITIKKGHIHSYWHFERDAGIPLPPPPPPPQDPVIFAPHKVVTRGRPRKDRSTRRDPSQFEIAASPAASQRRPGRVGGEISAVSPIYKALSTSTYALTYQPGYRLAVLQFPQPLLPLLSIQISIQGRYTQEPSCSKSRRLHNSCRMRSYRSLHRLQRNVGGQRAQRISSPGRNVGIKQLLCDGIAPALLSHKQHSSQTTF